MDLGEWELLGGGSGLVGGFFWGGKWKEGGGERGERDRGMGWDGWDGMDGMG